jgi:hypothetical protein
MIFVAVLFLVGLYFIYLGTGGETKKHYRFWQMGLLILFALCAITLIDVMLE